ncbi:hypothetical protein ACI8B_50105 [Acinetobacter proteolyticus]|uniref:Uncharacterized protein n=1 Tax=Acinetobacter proteolyticus TaxID=1776741 RepID=A0A653K9H0_9GAMM|nr:hypothetical protein ACI8B_50105 [Acinetobacter proteolyticus]
MNYFNWQCSLIWSKVWVKFLSKAQINVIVPLFSTQPIPHENNDQNMAICTQLESAQPTKPTCR